ncbi:hypothetical protein BGX38DRAFT_1251125 [Terfezia claveryi]|nr:hypothetical protein BGX38DRAFT_1251125 [Terfezia claveryi]
MAQQIDRTTTPTIYTAVYSGISVYEMTVNNVAVMRRRNDSWLNATQILKVAGIEKGKRTKVLEKEILNGVHEKVQGGYGKYQGTWIEHTRGVQFCKEYGVYDLLAPLLNFEMNTTDKPDTTPTKEQALAAKRKRMYHKTNGSTGPNFPPISSTVTNAFATLNRTRVDSPGPRQTASRTASNLSTVATMVRQEPQREAYIQPPPPPLSMPAAENFSYSQPQPDSAYASQAVPSYHDSQQENEEPPMKRPRPEPRGEALPPIRIDPILTVRPAEPLQPVEPRKILNLDGVRQTLMDLFVEKEGEPIKDYSTLLRSLTPDEIDVPMDSNGSAAIHWAASLAKVSLLKTLIERGASIFRVNDSGETALVRGCFVTNNYTQNSFPALLEFLYPTIPLADKAGRTILHHIAIKSGMKGRSADSRYYLECLLEFVVKHGASRGHSQSNEMGLAKFISEVVNSQDEHGDTALNIAARIGNKLIIQQLLDIGADSKIPNRAGLRPIDFGIGGEPTPNTRDQTWVVSQAVVQKSRDILDCKIQLIHLRLLALANRSSSTTAVQEVISGLDKEFRDEIEQKQQQHNAAISQLQNATRRYKEEEQKLEQLRKLVNDHAQKKQNCQNLRRALDEERAFCQSKLAALRINLPSQSVKHPEPDEPFRVSEEVLGMNNTAQLSEAQVKLLKSLPQTSILRTRVEAYQKNSEGLKRTAGALHDRSADLEQRFRRVVALCTGVPENEVDGVLHSLLEAVESDPTEVDTGRLSSFLRKVDESVRPN